LKDETPETHKIDADRNKVNTSDLRNMLKQVLDETAEESKLSEQTSSTLTSPEQDEATNKEESTSDSDVPPSQGKILKPGDTVTF
jgi:uncharacterized Zn ribbon protein